MARKVKKTSKVSFKPTAGYLLIEPAVSQTKTDSGIYLPDSLTGEKPQKGKVLGIGPDEVTDSGAKRTSPCKVGDIVVYKKWGGNEFKVENKEYLFVKFEDVLAVEG